MSHHLDFELRHGARGTFDRADGAGAVKEVGEVCDVHGLRVLVLLRLFIAQRRGAAAVLIAVPPG